jgi:DNA-binding response OmpR family regulator
MAGSRNVMLVEDEVALRQLYRAALVEAGHTVMEAESADELYVKLLNFHPQYIFLDVMLPGVSGLEILKDLRNNPARGCMDSKIVILTNLGQRSVADGAMEEGADGFIIKADILPKEIPKVIDSLEEDEDTGAVNS